MKYIADLHIHSHFSIATSKNLVPQYLDYWARLKGITVVGTGDFTHPGWVRQLKEELEPAEEGLFRLRDSYRTNKELATPFLPGREVRFVLSAEISTIYKKNGRVRKVHNVILAPDFETVERIQQKLTALGGNITSDGRPILGLDARDLLEIALNASPRIFFIPAHIWTPWFSALGSKSGFDSIVACYDDLAPHIYAVETGLSTDPAMNWMCGFLDKYTLISNSDAHSPEKLGRNANRFNTELSYEAMTAAMKSGDPALFGGTIDMFPQEGKYHYDGHRKCGICWNPVQTLQHKGICPVCKKVVTVGVMSRVVQLSDREDLSLRPNRLPFDSIIPLKEMLAELEGTGPNSKKVDHIYMELLKKGVSELELLVDTPPSEIERIGGGELGEAVRRMRNREIHIQEGFDGQFGIIKVFGPKEKPHGLTPHSLFKEESVAIAPEGKRRQMLNFNLEEYHRLKGMGLVVPEDRDTEAENGNRVLGLNRQQLAAVEHFQGPALVIAGPGTGKTRVLTERIKRLIHTQGINPGHILGVTFTNKAAAEMRERLTVLLENTGSTAKPLVTTFHALGYRILLEQTVAQKGATEENGMGGLAILDSEDKKRLLQRLRGVEKNRVVTFSDAIAKAKQQLKQPRDITDTELAEVYGQYEALKKEQQLVDLEDLIAAPVWLLQGVPEIAALYRERFQWVLIDEYQDINFAQYQLVRCLQPDVHANICVIGDPDQAIYGFRGADVSYIRQFHENYPGAAFYRLQQSYRCSDSILKASGDVMGRGSNPDVLLTGLERGIKIKIVKNNTDKSEAEFVARTIEQMMGGLRFFSMDSDITVGDKEKSIESLADFVVLCRTRAQMEVLEKAFRDHSIPFQVIGDEPFFKQEPVCSIVDLLKLARHPQHELVQERLIEKKILKDKGETLGELEGSVVSKIKELVERYFKQLTVQEEGLVKRLLDFALDFGENVERFLQFVLLGTAADTYHPGLENVTLMTIHAAKGLEFKAVFIVGCEEGLLPYSLYANQVTDREEERRLLYVGMTRAQKFLYLSYAGKRVLRGREYRLERSSFLDSIEKKLIEQSQQEYKKKEEKEPVQRKLFEL